MPHIQQLSPHVADLIAAGEVVERPASVVKELLENSIDAGATAVTVEIRDGGMTYLRVSDDGRGIAPDELPTAFLRHATSKLSKAEDLAAIGTLGFRGEALAAISAVSRLDIASRVRGAAEGASLHLEGGVPGEARAAGCPEGTSVVVRDLFFNTPARLKFMKRDSAEAAAVSGLVTHLALSRPDVSFKLVRDGAETLHTPGDGVLKGAVYAALGREFSLNLVGVRGLDGALRVEGFVTRPLNGRGTRGMQTFFVNGRFVKSQLLTAALEEAYANRSMKGKFPGCVLNVALPCDMVDVNVHPAKTVVKFLNEKQVFDLVYHGVKDALDREAKPVEAAKGAGQAQNPRGDFYQTMSAGQFRARQGGTGADGARNRAASGRGAQGGADGLSTWDAGAYFGKDGPNAGQNGTLQSENAFRTSVPPADSELGGRARVSDYTRDASGRSAGNGQGHGNGAYFGENRVNTGQSVEDGRFARDAGADFKGNHMFAARNGANDKNSGDFARNGAYVGESRPYARQDGVCTEKNETTIFTAERESAEQRESAVGQTTILQEIVRPWRIAGEVLDTYIVCEDAEKNVWLVDKHAAHERVNFDRFKAQDEPVMAQSLLTPLVANLPDAEYGAVAERLGLLREFGFDCEEFGDNAVIIREIPADIDEGDAVSALEEIAGRLVSGHADPSGARDALLATLACKAAIKGGRKSDERELRALVDKVQTGEIEYCPHGRPVKAKLTKYELEKMFKRIV